MTLARKDRPVLPDLLAPQGRLGRKAQQGRKGPLDHKVRQGHAEKSDLPAPLVLSVLRAPREQLVLRGLPVHQASAGNRGRKAQPVLLVLPERQVIRASPVLLVPRL